MTFSYQALWAEINNDPLGRGYSGSSDAGVARDLNLIYAASPRTRNKATMEAYQVFNAINKSEFNALGSASQTLVWNILNNGRLNPFGLEAELLTDIFRASSSTIRQLANDRKDNISRADELGFGVIKEGHVAKARAQFGGE